MKKHFIFLFIAISLVNIYGGNKVEVWKQSELIFKSSRCYDNPFMDVEIYAVFVSSEGDTIRRPGFWDGESTWKVRFAPTKTGRWNYTISNNVNDKNLQGNGFIDAVKYKGNLPVYKNGFVKISGDNRHFVFDNGKPFYYLGDTHWFITLEKWDECNVEGCTSQFKFMADKRAKQGFTVYQVQTNGCRLVEDSVTSVDISAFRDIDRKFDYLVNKGFVITTSIGSAHNYALRLGIKGAERLAKYWVARYGAYPVIWMTGQEVDLDKHKYLAVWKAAAEEISRYDDYRHPHSAHMWDNSNAGLFDKDEWHNFHMVQGGHIIWGGGTQTKSFYENFFAHKPVKPFLEAEANYEGLGKEKQCTTEDIRNAAYKSMLCGSLGFGYGVQGIWENCYTTEDCGCCAEWGAKSWYDGLMAEGGNQMIIMKNFFQSLEWWKLEPCFDDISRITINTDSDKEREKAVLSSISDEVFVLYLYAKKDMPVIIKNLNKSKKYNVSWFNPRDGKYEKAAISSITGVTEFKVPEKPTGDDYLLIIKQAGK
jgi:hypothetical protein